MSERKTSEPREKSVDERSDQVDYLTTERSNRITF